MVATRAFRHPIAVAISFVDRINHGDAKGLGELMNDDYELRIFDEPPERGREQGIEGWRGYAAAFPEYVIHPHRFSVDRNRVAILGHTTGSHLGLPDDEEAKLTLIWLAEIRDGRVSAWTLVEDTPQHRETYALD